jgi:hypothetical protein
VVRQRVALPAQAAALRTVIWQNAPRMPARFHTPAQVARFKRAQRAFDQVVLDVQLASPQAVQNSNSIAAVHSVKLLDFDHAHRAAR